MRPTRSPWLAASSALFFGLLLAVAACAETRPHYGGTLRIQTQAAIFSLAPLARNDPNGVLLRQVWRLVYDSDPAGEVAPPKQDGPFRVLDLVPGIKLTLAANEERAGGRPFLDRIEILMAQPPREQMVALQLGRADVIDVPAEAMRRASQEGVRWVASSPIELVAIFFSANSDARVREAISLAVDRAAIFNVLLGRQGEPTAALLPDWMTGYGFLFDAGQNVTRARQLAVDAGRARPITLGYDPKDALARAIVERIALDARAAGLNIVPGSLASADGGLMRIRLSDEDPRGALVGLAATLGPSTAPATPNDPQALYQSERKLRDELRAVPLLHLPVAYGVAPRVKGWTPGRAGAWSLADVWLEQQQKEQKP